MSRVYKTVQGDMWDSISFSQLGDERYTDFLILVNPQYRDVYIFSSGCELTIPDVEEKIIADDLPPWKKVSG